MSLLGKAAIPHARGGLGYCCNRASPVRTGNRALGYTEIGGFIKNFDFPGPVSSNLFSRCRFGGYLLSADCPKPLATG